MCYYANISCLKTSISHVKSWNFKIETTLITQVGRLEVLTRLRWRSNNHESRRFRSTIWALQVLRSQCNQGTHCTSEKSLLSWEVLAFNAEAVWSASAKTHLSSCKPTKKTRWAAEAIQIWVGLETTVVNRDLTTAKKKRRQVKYNEKTAILAFK